MDTPLSPAEMAARLDARVGRRLVPLLAALASGFAFFGAMTLVFRPPGATIPLAAVDTGGAMLLGASALVVHRRGLGRVRAHDVAGAALLVTLAASLVAIKLLHLPAQTTNVLLLELVASVTLLSLSWSTFLVGVALVGWAAVARSEGFAGAWLDAAFALVVTSIMAMMVQLVRLRDARATEQLAAANEEKATRLADAVETERLNGRRLAAANDSLEAFGYVVAHDLKEPLRSMGVFIEDARATNDDAERDELLERAARSQEQLRRLVTGLLELSLATTTPLEPVPVDVGALLDEPLTRQLFERALAERHMRLVIGPRIPRVLATPELLRQVLGNLVLNAARHHDKADGEIRIRAGPARGGLVELVIEDDGPGIPEHVIQRMRTTQPSTVRGGFGLAIAKRATARLGGELRLENRTDAPGARVHLALPAAGAESA